MASAAQKAARRARRSGGGDPQNPDDDGDMIGADDFDQSEIDRAVESVRRLAAAHETRKGNDDSGEDSGEDPLGEHPHHRHPKHGTRAAAEAHLATMREVPGDPHGARIIDKPISSGADG